MKRILGIALAVMGLAGLLAAAEIKVGADLPGKVKFVRVQEGQRVRQGQILAILENDEQAARCAEAVAELRQAKTPVDMATARARVDQSYATWYKTFVRAPAAGVVVRRNLQAGDSILEIRETPVVTLAVPSPLGLRASLKPKK
jgi:multidrug resistance efflux pump